MGDNKWLLSMKVDGEEISHQDVNNEQAIFMKLINVVAVNNKDDHSLCKIIHDQILNLEQAMKNLTNNFNLDNKIFEKISILNKNLVNNIKINLNNQNLQPNYQVFKNQILNQEKTMLKEKISDLKIINIKIQEKIVQL